MKEIVLWEQMCCISSCVLCKQTNTGLHWSAEWKSLKPCLGLAIWAQRAWGEWKGGGGGKVHHSFGCNNSRSPLRSFWSFPGGNSPYLLMGVCTRLSTGRRELHAADAKNPSWNVASPWAAAFCLTRTPKAEPFPAGVCVAQTTVV